MANGQPTRLENLLMAIGAAVMLLLLVIGFLSDAHVDIPLCLIAAGLFFLWAKREKWRRAEMAQVKYKLSMLDPKDPECAALRARYDYLDYYYQRANYFDNRTQYRDFTPPNDGNNGLGGNSGV